MAKKNENAKAGKISETGHARNVAAFKILISFCEEFGAKYNPVKDNITLPQLEAMHQQALLSMVNLKIEETALNNATNDRQVVFRDLKPLSTRLVNALAATGATEETMKDARAINLKIQGQRATKTKPVATNGGTDEESKKISTSQQSYDQLLEHFTKMAELLKQQPQYKPNEPELNNAGLDNKLQQLREANRKVTKTYTTWSSARIYRNRVMYDPLTGLTAVAFGVKRYVKSVFGAKSAEFKQVSGIEIRKH